MKTRILPTVLALVICVGFASSASAQGIILPAAGPVNRAMGGASSGAAIESIGAMTWNPATIGGLNNEMAFSFETLFASYEVSSTFPAVGSGVTDSNNVNPVPNIAWIYRPESRPDLTLGVALLMRAGYATNVPADATNPVLLPPPAGNGKINADAMFFQMPTTLAVQLSPCLTVAAGPVLTMARLGLDQNPFVAPNINGVYPDGNATRYHFGGSAQLGFYYVPNCCWSFGANVSTPTWIEPLRYFSEDAFGLPRVDKVNATLPAYISAGFGYRPNPNVLFTADARYFDYQNTELAGEAAAFLPDFSIDGLGWKSVFSAHVGTRIRLTERTYLMAGYFYTEDLIDDANAFFNVGAELGYQHGISLGSSVALSQTCMFSWSYQYIPEWGSTGPIVLPIVGPVPGSSVTNKADAHALTFGVNVNY